MEISLDLWVYREPPPLPLFPLMDSPPKRYSHSSGGGTVIRGMNRHFVVLSHLVAGMPARFCEYRTEHVLRVLAVDIQPTSECVLQVVVVGFPCNYHCIRAPKVRFIDSITGVRYEELADVREHHFHYKLLHQFVVMFEVVLLD